MRRAILLRSVARVLGGDTDVTDAAYMWSRHRWTVPYALVVLAGAALFTPLVGVDDWPTRIVIGLGAAAIAVTATTEYRVLAETATGLVVLRASRIRQVATEVLDRLDPDADFEQVGGTIIAADWEIGGRRYTVPRSSDEAMGRMAAGHRGG